MSTKQSTPFQIVRVPGFPVHLSERPGVTLCGWTIPAAGRLEPLPADAIVAHETCGRCRAIHARRLRMLAGVPAEKQLVGHPRWFYL